MDVKIIICIIMYNNYHLNLLKMKKDQIQIIIGANLSTLASLGYHRFQIGCVFAEYVLFKSYYVNTKFSTYQFMYKFDTVFMKFLRQEHLIELARVSIKSFVPQVSAYTPFHFSFTVSFKSVKLDVRLDFRQVERDKHNMSRLGSLDQQQRFFRQYIS